jgi:peptidoglycan/LPS O-acetylase OafA/YrhL
MAFHDRLDERLPCQSRTFSAGEDCRAEPDYRQNGVDLFFALSAYLITELLLRERRSYGAISVQSFYVRRALRIWPLYENGAVGVRFFIFLERATIKRR